MTDKEENSLNAPKSMSSSLSDSWSMVNKDGHILDDDDDDDSCSTASSVEVVEEDIEEDESLQTSLGTSPGAATPKGPLFVLRLSSHEVSDTDDDKASSIGTEDIPESVPDSQSFDILTDQNKETMEDPLSEISLGASEVQTTGESDNSGVVDKLEPNTQEQDINQSKVVEEHVESLVQALHKVQSNLKPNTDRPDILNGDQSRTTETNESIHSRNSPNTSNSSLMNQSMERTENAGDQELIESIDGEETESNDEAENQIENHGQTYGEKIRRLCNWLKDQFVQWSAGLSRDTLVLYLCIVVAVMFLASTFTAYNILLKKEKASKCAIEGQYAHASLNAIEEKLMTCRQSEDKLRVELSRVDNCQASLKEAIQIVRRWTYTSPDQLQSEVDKYLTESKGFCGAKVDSRDKQTDCPDHQDLMERNVNTMTFLLKRIIKENLELKDSIQISYLEFSSLKASLEESEYKLALAERKLNQETKSKTGSNENEEHVKEKQSNEDNDQEQFDKNEGETNEEAKLDKCVNVILEYYRHKFNKDYQFDWFTTGSQTIREYISGYLSDTIPGDLWYFLEKMNLRQATPPEPNDDHQSDHLSDKQGTSGSSDWQDNKDTHFEEGNSDEEDSVRDHSYNEQNRAEYTSSRYGQWADTVLDMMNKTRNQLQDTWQQVKNVSETLWEKHEPALTKLQNTFTRKLEHLSKKFQEKLVKKARKWFNKGKNRNKEFVKTTRREEKEDKERDDPVEQRYICSKNVMEIGEVILRLNANSYKKLENKRRILKQLKRIRRRENIPGGDGLSTWLDCQIDWWSHSLSRLFDREEYQVKERCIDSIECWQMEVSAVDILIGRTRCRRLKKKRGNVSELTTACEGIASAYNTGRDSTNDKHDFYTENESDVNNHNHDNNDNNDDDDDDDSDGDGKSSDNNDDGLDGYFYNIYDNDFGESNEDSENWFLKRAEMREYHHTEPDDWYFRRHKQRQEESTRNDL